MDDHVSLSPRTDVEPVACTLNHEQAEDQLLEWVDLQDRATAVVSLDDGVAMSLPASLANDIEDLVRRESACCAFLSITTSIDEDVLTLEIRSPNPDALPVIMALSGVAQP